MNGWCPCYETKQGWLGMVGTSMGMNMEMRGEETWRAAAVEQGREVGGSLPKSGHANRTPGAGLG